MKEVCFSFLPQFTVQHAFCLQHRLSREKRNRMIACKICNRLKFQEAPTRRSVTHVALRRDAANPSNARPAKISLLKSSSLQVFSLDVPLIAEANTPPWSTRIITRHSSPLGQWDVFCHSCSILRWPRQKWRTQMPCRPTLHCCTNETKIHHLTQRLHHSLWPAQKHHLWKPTRTANRRSIYRSRLALSSLCLSISKTSFWSSSKCTVAALTLSRYLKSAKASFPLRPKIWASENCNLPNKAPWTGHLWTFCCYYWNNISWWKSAP